MQELLIAISLVGTLQVTAYRAVPEQTKPKDCDWTSIGDRTTQFGVAVSQDLLKSGKVHYGDILYVEGDGFRVVNDCMNERLHNAVDLFVMSYQEEKRVGVTHRRVWLISRKGVLQCPRNDIAKAALSKCSIPTSGKWKWGTILGSIALIGIGLMLWLRRNTKTATTRLNRP